MFNPTFLSYMMLYFSSFLMVISCYDWFMIWLGLEINMISFIILVFNKFNLNNIESCLKYFFIQSMGSVLLMYFFYNEYTDMYILLILCYKMGGGPFYFWFPSLCKMISWWSCFFLMTFQKIVPLILMMNFISSMIWILGFLSLIIGLLGSMNQINMKCLMAYSSIHHIGWMFISVMIDYFLWMMYLVFYILLMINLIMLLNNNKINLINQSMSMKVKIYLLLSLMNMSGIPPMLGFFMKWLMFYKMMIVDLSLLLFMIIYSVMMLYVYFRLIYDYILNGINESWFNLILLNFNLLHYDMLVMMSMSLSFFFGILMLM